LTKVKGQDKKIIRSSIGKIILTARIAMKRSASKLEKINCGTDEKQKQILRKEILDNLEDDLLHCGLHGTNIHTGCRDKICRFFPKQLQIDFENLCEQNSAKTIIVSLEKFIKATPEIHPVKNQIIKQVK
jgi:hypothetical protein